MTTTSSVNYGSVACKVCNQPGGIGVAKLRRFSGPVVAIGYILLVPSVLGMLFGAFMLLATCMSAKTVSDATDTGYQEAIASIDGLTPTQVSSLRAATTVPSPDRLQQLGLTTYQVERVHSAWSARSAGDVGAGIGVGVVGGIAIFAVVASFVGGLLGWLLTMKRKVLLCRLCNGVHADVA
jgi:hypothetical protein